VSVWVAGEALIDLFGTASDEKAIVGGGAANTAKSLSRLESLLRLLAVFQRINLENQ